MSKYKVLAGSWLGQIGEFVRHEAEGVVLRMTAGRLVEFKPEHVEPVAEPDEPKAAE